MARNLEIRDWVQRLMYDRKITQEELGEILGLSQAAIWGRLSDRPDKPDFKLREIEKLEQHFGVASPVRSAYAESAAPGAIGPNVLRGVVKHIAREYPGVITIDADSIADAIIALCEYVQNTNGRPLTRAESMLALRGLAKNDGHAGDKFETERINR